MKHRLDVKVQADNGSAINHLADGTINKNWYNCLSIFMVAEEK